MKKFAALSLAIVMALALVACGGAASTASSAAASTASSAAASTADSAAAGITGPADLVAGVKIGVQLGTTGDIYASDIEGAEIQQFNKGAEAVLALQQGKLDCVIIDDQPAKVFAEQNDDIQVLEEAFTVEDYAMCLSKDNTELTEAFNGAIAELKADGTLQALMDYYIGGADGAAPYESTVTEYPNGKLVMATNAAFPPYEYVEDNTVKGLDADFAKAICDKLGYDLEIQDIDFDAIIPAVQSGRADFGAAGMTVTEDRLKSIDFTESYCTASQVIIVKK